MYVYTYVHYRIVSWALNKHRKSLNEIDSAINVLCVVRSKLLYNNSTLNIGCLFSALSDFPSKNVCDLAACREHKS